MTAQDAPKVTVGALIEVEATEHGWIGREAAYLACRGVWAVGSGAAVLVRGPIFSAPASAEAARVIGASLAEADDITVWANGPGALDFAAAVQAAAVEERAFRAAHGTTSG